MNIAEYSIEKKVIMYLLVIVLLLGGVFGYMKSGRLEDPAFTIRQVKVFTPYPGATPEEVEQEVTDLIESAAQKLPQLDYVESVSSTGMSEVSVWFKQGITTEEYRQIYDELRKKVRDVQSQLPPGTGTSWVNDDFADVYGMLFAITGDGFSEKELYDFSENLQKKLLLVDGVAKVELWGIPKEVVYVEISQTKLKEMQLSPDDLKKLISNQNLVVESGDLLIDTERPYFRVSGDFDNIGAIGDIRIPSKNPDEQTQIKLSDIADIYKGYSEPPDKLIRFNGRPGIAVAVSAISTYNVVEVGERIKTELYKILENTPMGIELNVIYNQPSSVETSVNNFVMNLVQSVTIVIGLLVIFMGLQSGIIIGFMLLLIVAGTLLFMYTFNITLQRISLGALIVAMGMLVDNSIVITDGILVRMQKGMNAKKAGMEVVKQTMWPLFGATIVAIFAFGAVGLSQDSTGEYTRSLFQVIIISLTLSWFLAITVNPLICFQFMKIKTPEEKKKSSFKWLENLKAKLKPKKKVSSKNETGENSTGGFIGWFEKILAASLRKSTMVIIGVLVLLVISVIGYGKVTKAFFPSSGQPQFLVDYFLPEGTDISKTKKDIIQIEKYLLDKENFPEIKQVSSYIGASPPRFQLTFNPESANPRMGQLLIEVYDPETIADVLPKIQSYLDNNYPQAIAQVYRFQLGPGAKGLINARFSGPDPVVLRSLAEKTKSIFNATNNALAVKDDWGNRAKYIKAVVDEKSAKDLGITRPMINQTLKSAYDGISVGLYRENNRLMPIIFRHPADERSVDNVLNDLYIWSPVLKQSVPVSQVVTSFKVDWEDTRINRRHRQRTIEITCDPKKGEASALLAQVKPKVEALELPPGYSLEWGGQYEDSARANEGISKTFPFALLAMFLTLLILWNKVKQPIIIYLSIPLSLIGVVAGLVATGFPFSFMALMGLLALFGMVIKNAIVLVDEIDLRISEGGDKFDAIVKASSSRVRPVMMAALSTVLGMAPLLPDLFFQGMAVTIMAGLTIAAVITLIVTPVLYKVFFGIKEKQDTKDEQKIITENNS